MQNMTTLDETLLWEIRAFIYEQFAQTARPPTPAETATRFQLEKEQAASFYEELHRRHALFLDPATNAIRMANPFSAVPTDFRVYIEERMYWANCAWDTLGIPAALHRNAVIEARCAQSNQPITLAVRDAEVIEQGERVHFLLPFRRWYDDLVFT
jgi:hypothetical protein